MENRLLCSGQFRGLLMLSISLLFVVLAMNIYANTNPNYLDYTKDEEGCEENYLLDELVDPPFFTEFPPANITVNCIADVPLGVNLEADDDFDPDFPKDISPVDSPDPGLLDGCTEITITRSWTAVDVNDDNASTTVFQFITVLADTQPPTINVAEVNDTVSCETADFATWLNSRRLQVATNISDNCSIASYTDDGTVFPGDCGTVAVTFSIFDECGNTVDWVSTYTIEDNEDPVLLGVPANVNLNCDDAIPGVPVVITTDNCTVGGLVSFNEVSTQILDGSCNEYTYTILRTWSSTDDCGNQFDSTQQISIIDNSAPTFTVPGDIGIECSVDPNNLGITGNVIDAADNCDPTPSVTFTDNRIDGTCPGDYVIERTWRVEDVCGNINAALQTITVTDNTDPTFTVPVDITVDCSLANDLGVTGQPTNVADNCDANPVVLTPVDVISNQICLYSYTITRTWRVEDFCGNFTEQVQIIQVTDTNAPIFQSEATDLTLDCVNGIDLDSLFNDWISLNGNAVAFDLCEPSPGLVWQAYNTGTTDPATLPSALCPVPDSIVRRRVVDFQVTDACGNSSITTATFSVRDITPPTLMNCQSDTIIGNMAGLCTGSYTFLPPIIEDECAVAVLAENINTSMFLTSNANPGEEGDIPVNPLMVDLIVTNPLPVNAFTDGVLIVALFNADAEEATEFFNIYGEDGSFIGTTANTATQCGDSDTTFFITRTQINEWGIDGVISLSFEPNIPDGQPGRFAINDLCPANTTLSVDLSYSAKDLSGISYGYSINQGTRVVVDPVQAVTVDLDEGVNLITLYASDCAGNIDSCSYNVTVEDREAPVITCPTDITVALGQDSCTAYVTLPLPMTVTDNCKVGDVFEATMPADTASAYLTYTFDPNLTDYLADDRSYSFIGVAANAMSPVELTIDLLGDFSDTGAFVSFYGENNTFIGSTTVGIATCTTPGQVTFTVSSDVYNSWAGDGEVVITAEVNDIPVPPGVLGDGINPCDAGAVTADGDTDGISYMFLSLSYNQVTPSFFTEGATVLPLTDMEPPAINPVLELNQGETDIFYIITDEAGNLDTCTFTVMVEDNQLPEALCQPTTVFINPSGLVIDTVAVADIDAGSSDNCGIDTMYLTPNTFTCESAGSTIFAVLTVVDEVGNTNTCTSPIRVETLAPEPTANTDLCGGDSLFLFANPPEAVGGIIYTYLWNGPNGFVSTLENPIIANVSSANAGSYSVEVTGITGCTALGIVEVAIEDSPATPFINTVENICTDEDIIMTSSVVPIATNVQYFWYQGIPDEGVLINTTTVPSLTIPAPHLEGSTDYYLIIEADGCTSNPSSEITITTTDIPTAVVDDPEITICEGESITLGTFVAGPGVTYSWTGPNGFVSDSQFPPVITSATLNNAGVYTLIVSRNGCPSDPAFSVVNIIPQPELPQLINDGPICEGEIITLSTNIIGASLYRWIAPDFEEILTATNTLTLDSSIDDVEGNWTVQVTQLGCPSEVSLPSVVEVNPIPTPEAAANPSPVCEGNELVLEATPDLANATYSWTGPNGFTSVAQRPTISNASMNNSGTYTVEVTTEAGCSNTAEVEVNVLEGVSITAVSNNAPACLSGPIDVSLVATVFPPDDGTYIYSWTGPNGFTSPDEIAIIPNATQANNGNYQLVVTSGSGCLSQVANTVVDATDPPLTPGIPAISSSTPAPFCTGEELILTCDSYIGTTVNYNWMVGNNGIITTSNPSLTINNLDPSDSGFYSVFVTVDGCPSSESGAILINVSQSPVISASSNAPVCEGGSVQLMTDFIPGAEYEWTGPNGFTASVFNPVLSPASPQIHNGTYCVVVSEDGCSSNVVCINVEVETTPETPVPSVENNVCLADTSAVLELAVLPSSATPGASYTWIDDNNDTLIMDTPNLNLEVDDLGVYGPGTHGFRVYASLGNCISPVSLPLEVSFDEIPVNQAFAGNDTTVCDNQLVLLNAEVPSTGSGFWSLVDGDPMGVGITNPDQATTSVTGLVGGNTYVFRWTLSSGACLDYDFDEIELFVNTLEEVEAGESILACASETITLDALPSLSGGEWSQTGVQEQLGINIINPEDPNAQVTGLQPGNLYEFTWTINSNCGELSDNVFVLISDPFPYAGEDTVICSVEGVLPLNATSPTDGSMGQWSSPNTNINFTDAQDPQTIVQDLEFGQNILIWEIDNGACGDDSRDTVIINYKNSPEANPDQFMVDYGQQINLDVINNDFVPENTDVQILIKPENGTIDTIGNGVFGYTPGFNFVGTDQFVYQLVSDGCISSETVVELFVGEDAECAVPSIFTPNGDGINDEFIIPCLLDQSAFPESQVLIFNQWGDEVFRSQKPYQSTWMGTFNGEDLPSGTYFYVVDYGGAREPESGYVIIQR